MNINLRLLLLCTFILLTACGKQARQDIPSGGRACSLTVRIAQPAQTLTSYATEDEGLKMNWQAGDRISIVSLSAGKAVTVDSFTATEEGAPETSFSGTYTGAAGADIVCVYPELLPVGDGVFESAPLAGNTRGFFTLSSGSARVVFAPEEGMAFIQEANGSWEHISGLDLMTGTLVPVDGSLGSATLQKRMGLIRCNLSIPEIGDEEAVHSLNLNLSEGKPFTDYSASLSLASPAACWSTASPRPSFTLQLGGFSLSGKDLTAYLPIFPNSSYPSMGGAYAKSLEISVASDAGYHSAVIDIPEGSASTYSLYAGGLFDINAILGSAEGPVLGDTRPFAEFSNTANSLWIDGNTLYAGDSGHIRIYDVSSPLSPSLVSTINLQGQVRQMTSSDGKLFATCRETGTWIYDISERTAPVLLKRFDCVELATGIDVAGNCLFIGQRQNGVEFVDITNPSQPAHIRIIPTDESQSVFYADGYLYSGEWSTGKVTIFDVRDLSDIRKLGAINLQGYGDGLWISGNRLYASTGHHHRNSAPKVEDGDGHGVEIWDISDRSAPVFISRTEFDVFYKTGTDYWTPRPSGNGKTLFCSDTYNGAYVLDISNETAPEIIAHFTSPSNLAVTSMAVGTGALYFAAGKDGFMTVPCPRAIPSKRSKGVLPSGASARFSYTTSAGSAFRAWLPSKRGAVHSAAVYGDALFVACGNAGLSVVKKDGGGIPYEYSSLSLPFAGDVKVRGDRLYVAEGEVGVGVYKISPGPVLAPETHMLSQISPREDCRIALWLAVPNDRYLAVGSRFQGWQYIAVSGSQASPEYTFRQQNSLNVNYNKYIADEVCGSNLLPYATRSGFVWINLSSGSGVTVSDANTSLSNSMWDGVTNFKDGTALFSRNSAFHVMTAGDSSPGISSGSNPAFTGIPRWDGGNMVTVSHFGQGSVSVVDLTNPASPVVKINESTSGKPEAGTFWDGKAVIPCGYQGLLIEK